RYTAIFRNAKDKAHLLKKALDDPAAVGGKAKLEDMLQRLEHETVANDEQISPEGVVDRAILHAGLDASTRAELGPKLRAAVKTTLRDSNKVSTTVTLPHGGYVIAPGVLGEGLDRLWFALSTPEIRRGWISVHDIVGASCGPEQALLEKASGVFPRLHPSDRELAEALRRALPCTEASVFDQSPRLTRADALMFWLATPQGHLNVGVDVAFLIRSREDMKLQILNIVSPGGSVAERAFDMSIVHPKTKKAYWRPGLYLAQASGRVELEQLRRPRPCADDLEVGSQEYEPLRLKNDFQEPKQVVEYVLARAASGTYWSGLLDSERAAFTSMPRPGEIGVWNASQESFVLCDGYSVDGFSSGENPEVGSVRVTVKGASVSTVYGGDVLERPTGALARGEAPTWSSTRALVSLDVPVKRDAGRWVVGVLPNLQVRSRCRVRRAVAIDQALLPKDPAVIEALFNRAEQKRVKGDLDGAIADATEALRLDGRSVTALTVRGAAKHGKGELKGALEDFDEAVRLDPKSVVGLAWRADAKRLLQDFDGAIADATEVLRLDGRSAMALGVRGAAKQSKGDLKGSLADLDDAVQLDPKYLFAFCRRAEVKGALDDSDGAIADYTQALRIDPKNTWALNERGTTRRLKSDLKGALADYDGVIQIDSGNITALSGRGRTKLQSGDLEGALSDVNEAVRIDPKSAHSLRERAEIKCRKGDLEGSLEDCNESIRLQPDLESKRIRGLTYELLGKRDMAVRDLTEVAARPQAGFYTVVWVAVLGDKPTLLEPFVSKGDWVSSLAKHLLGQIDEVALVARANEGATPEIKRRQLCEAYGYLGLKLDAANERVAATERYEKCVATGVTNFMEYSWAANRLRSWTPSCAKCQKLFPAAAKFCPDCGSPRPR
ncbi:MAG: tetratricopeptide repeat protein, partial [Planctomycetota bacterium]